MLNRLDLVLKLLLLGAAGSSGCAAIGLTLVGVGAGTAAGTGVSYTLDSIAYKTFSTPEQGLRAATLKTLKRMDIELKENQPTEAGRKLVAVAGDRTVEIELDRLTSKTSRMRVNVKQGMFFKDRATATEIIIQTERTLEDEPTPTGKEPSPPSAAAPKK